MTPYVALLRAVNVGGTGKLPMADLQGMCDAAGFARARTYIASGNALFASDGSEAEVKAALETRLAAYAGRPVGVLVRTADALDAVLAANPFPDAAPNRLVVLFIDGPPPADAAAHARHRTTERIAPGARAGARELYVDYRDRDTMAGSRLTIPAAAAGTGRNLNTVARLAALARAL